jgi:NADH dehydrogenase
MMPVPVAGIKAAARLLDWNAAFPITRDQIEMLLEGNTCSPEAFVGMGIEPVSFDAESLRYLDSNNEENESWQQNAA